MFLITRNGVDSRRLTQNAEHFDAIAGSVYDESIPEHIMRHLTRCRINVVRRMLPAGRVLDVGCGTGRFLSALPADMYQRFGIDVSSGMSGLRIIGTLRYSAVSPVVRHFLRVYPKTRWSLSLRARAKQSPLAPLDCFSQAALAAGGRWRSAQ